MAFAQAFPWFDPFLATASDRRAQPIRDDDADRALDLLIVDDHPLTRRGLDLSLAQMGHQIVSAGTLRDACRLLRTLAVDVVICDFALPDGDAIELLGDWPDGVPRVPAIAISGVREADLSARCLSAGYDAFLPKPIDVATLARTLDGLARRPRGDGPRARTNRTDEN